MRTHASAARAAPARPRAAAVPARLSNRALGRLASSEHDADRVAMQALALRHTGRARSVRDAVGAVTGTDVSDVRVTCEPLAGAEGRALGGAVSVAPGSDGHVLAHELAHVALGHDADGRAHSFVRAERPQITNLDGILAEARRVANAHSSLGLIEWGRFIAAMGGSAPTEVVRGAVGARRSATTEMSVRYLYTCRCGLVDFRHFYQLMYLGLTLGNQSAVMEGRQHELDAEASSRFAPEDTVSNALGSLFGSQQSVVERVETFLSNLRSFLTRCGPMDWGTMSGTDQDAVVDYYDARGVGGVPVHQNETSLPAPPVSCPTPPTTIFPFVQGVTGGQWNTYTGFADD